MNRRHGTSSSLLMVKQTFLICLHLILKESRIFSGRKSNFILFRTIQNRPKLDLHLFSNDDTGLDRDHAILVLGVQAVVLEISNIYKT